MVLLLAFAALAAQQAQPAQPAAKPTQQAAADPLVCKTQWDTNSRIPTRVCHLKSEWEAGEHEQQERFKHQMNSSASTVNPMANH
jgi:hypothetical protein